MTDLRSCFLTGTKIQFAWDSTSLGYIKTCPRYYQYVMLDGWSPKGESVHLRFGQEYHKALEDFDKFQAEGLSRDDALRRVVLELLQRTFGWEVDETTKAGKYKNRKTLIRLVIDYLDKFNPDPAETEILEGGKPAVELSFKFELDWGPKASTIEPPYEGIRQPYLLCGHLDRVVSFSGDLFVMDRKTTTTTPSEYFFNQFSPNNQMTLYTLASKVILNAPIQGVIIDAGQILIDSSRFVRGFTRRTPDQLEEWVNDLQYWLSLAETFAENDYWPMNDTACDKFGGCRFREVCSKSPGVREIYLKSNFDSLPEESRWNPLIER